MGRPVPSLPQIAPSHGDLDPCLIKGSLGPPEFKTQMASRYIFCRFCRVHNSEGLTDRQVAFLGRPFVKRFALCYRTVVLSVLSVTLVHCDPKVGWIKMKLGMQVGLGAGHIVLDGDPAPPPPKGHSPQFSAHICCGQMPPWIKMPLGMEVGLGRGDFVLSSPLPKKGGAPNFRPMSIVAKRLDGSRRYLAWR